MQVSEKSKRLLAVAIGIIILVLAASEGTKDLPTPSKSLQLGIPYPQVPLDLDPSALDTETVRAAVNNSSPAQAPAPRPPVTAEAYLVANLETGEIYSQYNPRSVFPIASMSKLITALVALHQMQPDQKITITPSVVETYGDAGKLYPGEIYTVSELLYPLLLESSNDAAEAIATSYGYANFLMQMNTFVAELGMTSTAFRDASGLNSGNVSNARDLFTLARYLYSKEKSILEITRQISFTLASSTDHLKKTWNTINPFPHDSHFLGGKTGRTTEAKESMMSLFRYEMGGKSYPVVIIVLRSDFTAREVDSSYLFSEFIRRISK